jgi:hypothetical protein
MNIGVDVDGVFADFNSACIETCIKVTGKDLFPPRPFDIPTWHYPQHYGYSAEEMDFEKGPVWGAIKSNPTFWQTLPEYADTREALAYLDKLRRAGHDIYFVTNRYGIKCKLQTERWLRRHGFADPTVLVTGDKRRIAQALKLDAYVDDRWENAVDVAGEYKQDTLVSASKWVPSTTQSFLLVRPWNRRQTDRTDSHVALYGIKEVTTVVGFADSLLGQTAVVE